MRKRCPVSTGRDLNDFHAQYGRPILGTYDFPVCFTAAQSRLIPQHGHVDSFLLWKERNGTEGLIWSPWFHFFQAAWSQMRRLLSWKCSKKMPTSGSSWRLNGANIGKLIASYKVFYKHGAFCSVDYLGLFFFSALTPFWLPSHLDVSITAQQFLWAAPFFLLPLWPYLPWGSLAKGLGRAKDEVGDGARDGELGYLLPAASFGRELNKK